jgi:SAM-dependent MidA family methyltransferase
MTVQRSDNSTEAMDSIRLAIKERGPIPFDDFMRLALYGPGGYYSSGSPVSASDDFFTAPAAHPAFGALIAVQLWEMWQLLGEPKVFTAVEMGAGNGGLAADVTEVAPALGGRFAGALDYQAFDVEPPSKQHFPVRPVEEMPRGIVGCVLSNELLDAMPVRRFEARDGRLQEIFVGLEGGRLVEVLGPPSSSVIEERVGPLLNTLPDRYRGEVNDGLGEWARQVASTLRRGWALTIDYGFDRARLYAPERITGSLRCYYQHTLGQDPLRHVGRQDITAHVDFTALDEAMEGAGLSVAGHAMQSAFLERLGIGEMRDALQAMALARPEMRMNEAGMHALTDPAGMGAFRVAVHSRGVSDVRLTGFAGAQSRSSVGAPLAAPGLAAGQSSPATGLLAPPLLNPTRHINLLGQAQAQPGYFEVQSLEQLFEE